jgi:hypothetical protein
MLVINKWFVVSSVDIFVLVFRQIMCTICIFVFLVIYVFVYWVWCLHLTLYLLLITFLWPIQPYLLNILHILQTTFYPIRMLSVLLPTVTEHAGTHFRCSHRSTTCFSLAAHFSCQCTAFVSNTLLPIILLFQLKELLLLCFDLVILLSQMIQICFWVGRQSNNLAPQFWGLFL